jgi:hypothetical protein
MPLGGKFLILVVILVGALALLRAWPSLRSSAGWLFTWGLRMRIPLLLIAAPALLGALAWVDQYHFLGLLLVRSQTPWWALWDMWVITWMSFFTVGLGIGMARLIARNADERLEVRDTNGADTVSARPRDTSASAGWPFLLIAVWWVAALVFPGLCLARSLGDAQPGDQPLLGWLIGGIALGLVLSQAVALFLALAQRWTLGMIDDVADAGILPYEALVQRIPPWKIGRWKVPGERFTRWLFADPDGGLSWLLRGPGYTDRKSGILLPGHAQLLLVAFFSFGYYVIRYICDLYNTTWETLQYPSAFYVLVVFFLLGWFLSGLAFCLDRYRLPVIAVIVAWLVVMYGFTGYDHWFDLNHRMAPKEVASFVPPGPWELPGDDAIDKNCYLKALSLRPADTAGPQEQLFLGEVLDSGAWAFPEGENGRKTLVVVTASGGGIQAAAWTAKVLAELDRLYPKLSQSIMVISSVSGGSVGAMYYVGLRGVRGTKTALDAGRWDQITTMAGSSCLEACGWGVAFPDFVHTIIPDAPPRFVDRGYAMESVWWNRMAGSLAHRRAMSEVTIRDLAPLVTKAYAPAVIFNATCVETGQRVCISPLRVEVDRPGAASAPPDAQAHQHSYVVRPIDLLHWYDEALVDGKKADPRVSTAARLSATFSYVTPVASPYLAKDLWKEEPDLNKRQQLHFCDGGYADNAGLVTIVEMLRDLIARYQQPTTKKAPFDRVLVVRIEPFPPEEVTMGQQNRGFDSAFFGPTQALDASRVSTRAERGELEMRLLQEMSDPTSQVRGTVATSQSLALKVATEVEEKDKDLSSGLRDIARKLGNIHDPGDSSFSVGPGTSASRIQEKLDETIVHVEALQKRTSPHHAKQVQSILDDLKGGRAGAQRLADAFRGHPGTTALRPRLPVYSITFRFQPKGEHQPPLSWTLSREQLKAIDESWGAVITARSIPPFSADKVTFDMLKTYFP